DLRLDPVDAGQRLVAVARAAHHHVLEHRAAAPDLDVADLDRAAEPALDLRHHLRPHHPRADVSVDHEHEEQPAQEKREGGPADEEPPTTHQQLLYHADRAASPRGARRGQSALAGRGAGDRHDVRAATLQLVAADQVVVARVELDGAVDLAL